MRAILVVHIQVLDEPTKGLLEDIRLDELLELKLGSGDACAPPRLVNLDLLAHNGRVYIK